jgi:hypothetical protein
VRSISSGGSSGGRQRQQRRAAAAAAEGGSGSSGGRQRQLQLRQRRAEATLSSVQRRGSGPGGGPGAGCWPSGLPVACHVCRRGASTASLQPGACSGYQLLRPAEPVRPAQRKWLAPTRAARRGAALQPEAAEVRALRTAAGGQGARRRGAAAPVSGRGQA